MSASRSILIAAFVVSIGLSSTVAAQSGWFPVGLSVIGNGDATICFRNSDTGYCINGVTNSISTVLLKTFDGGRTWSNLDLGKGASPRIPHLFPGIGTYVLDGYDAVLSTRDGDSLWVRHAIDDSAGLLLLDYWFLSERTGFVVGSRDYSGDSERGVLLLTTDSGRTWAQTLMSAVGYFSEIKFRDSIHGYLVLDEYQPRLSTEVLQTTDGGVTWSTTPIIAVRYLSYSSATNLWSGTRGNSVLRWAEGESMLDTVVLFSDAHGNSDEISSMSNWQGSRAYVATFKGDIYTTTDGGKIWKKQITSPPFYQGPLGSNGRATIVASSDTVAYALGSHVLIKTTDGGARPSMLSSCPLR